MTQPSAADEKTNLGQRAGERLRQHVGEHDLREAAAAGLAAAKLGLGKTNEAVCQRLHDKPLKTTSEGIGTALGLVAGLLLGGGGIGIAAFGGAIGLPLLGITVLIGFGLGSFGGRDFDAWWKHLKDQWSSAAKRSGEVRNGSPAATVRLVGEEHRQVLEHALATASRTVSIRSASLDSAALDPPLLSLLRAAVERGVCVTIEYGRRLPLQDKLRIPHMMPSGGYAEAEASLAGLRHGLDARGRGRLLRCGATWTYLRELAVDDAWLVVGSFDWLSRRHASPASGSGVRSASAQLATELRMKAEEALERHHA